MGLLFRFNLLIGRILNKYQFQLLTGLYNSWAQRNRARSYRLRPVIFVFGSEQPADTLNMGIQLDHVHNIDLSVAGNIRPTQ